MSCFSEYLLLLFSKKLEIYLVKYLHFFQTQLIRKRNSSPSSWWLKNFSSSSNLSNLFTTKIYDLPDFNIFWARIPSFEDISFRIQNKYNKIWFIFAISAWFTSLLSLYYLWVYNHSINYLNFWIAIKIPINSITSYTLYRYTIGLDCPIRRFNKVDLPTFNSNYYNSIFFILP